MKKRLDVNEFIWMLILIGFDYYFYELIRMDRLTYFVHPKLFKYVYFALFAITFLIIYQIQNIFKTKSNGRLKLGYLLFMLILFLGFVIDPKGLNAEAAVNRGVNIGNSILNSREEVSKKPNLDAPQKRKAGGAVEVNDQNYMTMFNEISSNINEFKGNTITVTGFIYKEPSLEKNEFIAARMTINCCAADVEVVGYLCKYNGKEALLKGQWVKVTGIIIEEEVQDNNNVKKRVPAINIDKVERINEPVNKYLYE